MVELFGRETTGGEDARRRGRVVYMMPPLCERSECKGKEGGCFRRLLQTCRLQPISNHIISHNKKLVSTWGKTSSLREWRRVEELVYRNHYFPLRELEKQAQARCGVLPQFSDVIMRCSCLTTGGFRRNIRLSRDNTVQHASPRRGNLGQRRETKRRA
jgi:hypothetical protein